jgi:serine/threonine protein kinase
MSDQPTRLTAALADRYRIERELGQGGMATVYLADDLKHGRKVAVKVLRPELAAVLGAERWPHRSPDHRRPVTRVLELAAQALRGGRDHPLPLLRVEPPPADHDRFDPAGVPDVLQRVRLEQHQVGTLPGLDGPPFL